MQGGAGRRVRRRRCGSVTESPGPALAASPGSGVLYPSFRSASFLARRRWGRPGRQPLSCNWTRHECVQRCIFVELLVLGITQRRLSGWPTPFRTALHSTLIFTIEVGELGSVILPVCQIIWSLHAQIPVLAGCLRLQTLADKKLCMQM